MGNDRSYRQKKSKSQRDERISYKEGQQLAFALMQAREMTEGLIEERKKLRFDLARLSSLLTAAAIQHEPLVIDNEVLDKVFRSDPEVEGFYVRKAVDRDAMEVVPRPKFEEDIIPDPDEDVEEEEDIFDYEIVEVEGEQTDN